MAVRILMFALIGLVGCSSDSTPGGGDQEDAGSRADTEMDGAADTADDSANNGQPDGEADSTTLCEIDEARCIDLRTREICRDPAVGFASERCPDGEYCQDGGCAPGVCEVGATRCVDTRSVEECGAAGDQAPGWVRTLCDEEFACAEDECRAIICDPDEPPYCDGDTIRVFCPAPGVMRTNEVCLRGNSCVDGACLPTICTPGSQACTGQQVIICNDTGTGFDNGVLCETDDVGTICFEGNCIGACEVARRERSYIGCDYRPADLPISTGNMSNGFGIAVANTNETLTAVVLIEAGEQLMATLTIPPGEVRPWVDTLRPHNLQASGVFPDGFKVTSTVPVVAYQFNLYETIRSASTDASLLLPDHTLFNQYYGMTYSGDGGGGSEPYLAIYAVEPDTDVTVTPTSDVSASGNRSQVDFALIRAGQPLTVTLQPSEVFVLIGSGGDSDLTGSLVQATAPIGVFGGNKSTQVPRGQRYRDHLEQQTFPRQALGTRYVVGKSRARGNPELPDQVRILADEDDTTVRFNPPLGGTDEITLNAGQWREFPLSTHTEITSDGPVMVGHFYAGSGGPEGNSEGDPTFIMQVPLEQFRSEYVFLAPPTYTSDYVAIVAPPTARIEIDGVEVGLEPETVGDTTVSVTVVRIPDGQHRVAGDQNFGVTVYGFGGPPQDDPNRVQNVSYGYPAGLNLVEINPKE